MCELCKRLICPSACPNAPEARKVYICSGCGRAIREGDDYYDFLNEQFCEQCVSDARSEAVYDPY